MRSSEAARQGRGVVGSLDDDLVGADAVHPVEHALGLAVQVAFDSQRREFVGHDAHRPAGRIALGRRPAVRVGTISLNFGRSLALISGTERAEAALDLYGFAHEIGGTFGAIGGDDNPAADDGVFSEFRQLLNPFSA